MSLVKQSIAELIGTFWLVLGGCGSAVLACGIPNTGIGYLGVSLAFGLTVLTMAYAIGHISGCHLNPAVTLGLLASGRDKDPKRAVTFIIAQCIGGILAAALLFMIVKSNLNIPDTGALAGAFATNGWSTDGVARFGGAAYGMEAAFAIEVVLTFIFLFVIIGATDKRAPAGLAPIAIGLCLTLIHLISIPVTNTSVNPARSTAVAIFVGGEPVSQLWLFWVAPILGAVIAGLLYRCVFECKEGACCGGKCKCEDCKCDKPEVKADEKKEVKADVKPEVKADVKPEVKADEKKEVKADEKKEVKADEKKEVKADDKPEVKADEKKEAEADEKKEAVAE